LRLDTWEQEGQKRSKLRVRADRVQFLGSGGGGAPSGARGNFEPRAASAAPASAPARTGAVSEDRPPAPDDDDIPF
jgi:single-strand DNA-binding protein